MVRSLTTGATGKLAPDCLNSQIEMTQPDSRTMSQRRLLCPKAMHLRRPEDFEHAYSSGDRAGDDHLLMFVVVNQQGTNRLGLSVSRKHGSAVHRNVKRRRIREAFRLLQHDLPASFDIVAVPRQRDDSSLQDYRNSLRTLIRKLAKRLAARQGEANSSSGGGDES